MTKENLNKNTLKFYNAVAQQFDKYLDGRAVTQERINDYKKLLEKKYRKNSLIAISSALKWHLEEKRDGQ